MLSTHDRINYDYSIRLLALTTSQYYTCLHHR